MIDVENGEHQSSNTFLAHLYLSSNIPVKRLNTNLQTTSLGTLSCVQELVSTTSNLHTLQQSPHTPYLVLVQQSALLL